MNKEILEQLGIHPSKIRYKGKAQIIEDDKEKYVMKKNPRSNRSVYQYLESRNFTNFPPVLAITSDNIEVTRYIPDVFTNDEQKIEDMIYLLTVLHNKTTFYKELDLDEIKKIYEEMVDQFHYLFHYYQSIHHMIEEEVYMSPANYSFILHISMVYKILNYGLFSINHWYQMIQNKKTLRFVFNHNNLEKDHLRENDTLYFINWNKADFGFPTNDLDYLWHKNYEYLDLSSFLGLYQSKYKLQEEEYYYFLARACLLTRIDFNQPEQEKMKEIIYLVKYMEKMDDYLLKQNTKEANYQPQ